MKTLREKPFTFLAAAFLIGFSLFFVTGAVDNARAQDNQVAQEEAEGKIVWEKLRLKKISCAELSQNDFTVLGEYFMGQIAGSSHAEINEAIEQARGKEWEDQMHIDMGKKLSACDISAVIPSQDIDLMHMVLGIDSDQTKVNELGSFNAIVLILLWVFVIGGFGLLIKRLADQFRGSAREGGEESKKVSTGKKSRFLDFPFRMKISTKLSFLLLFAGLLPMAVFGFLYVRNEQAVLEKEIFNTLVLLAESKEVRVLEYFKDIIARTHDFSSDGYIRDETKRLITTGSSDARDALSRHLLVNKKPLDEKIRGISILDENGTVIASTDVQEIGKNESKDVYFKEGRVGATLVRTDPGDVHFGIVSPFVVAVPITDKDTHEFLGIIVNVFDSYKLEDILSENFITRQNVELESIIGENLETLHVYIVNQDRNVILSPVKKKVDPIHNVNVRTLPVQECLDNKKEILGEYTDHSGAQVFGASMCLEEEGLVLIVDIDKQEALMPVQKLQIRFYSTVAALVVLIGLLSFFISRLFTKPIKALRESAEITGRGNLRHRAVVARTRDEIEDLGHAFNAMTASLEDRQQVAMEEKRKLTVLLENLPVGVLMMRAADGEVMVLNHRGIELLGEGFKDDVQKWTRIKNEKGEEYPFEELPMSIALHTTHGATKNDLCVGKPGNMVALHMSAVPVADETGAPNFVVMVFDDVTKEKEVDRAKTEFVSLASHQLRTPLSTVNWYTEMLLAEDVGKITPDQKSYLEEIYRGNQRMVGLVNALLDVSRIEMGTFAMDIKAVDLGGELDLTLKEFEPMIKEKKMNIEKECAPDVPVLKVDQKMIHIIFQNLISNALKYTPPEGRIMVRVRREGNDRVYIEVSDTGYGIPKHQYDKIFTKLFRADNIVGKDTEGTGLGLYLVMLVVKQLKGEIRFVSEEKKGTSFFITIPIQ